MRSCAQTPRKFFVMISPPHVVINFCFQCCAHALVTFTSGKKRNFDVVVGADGQGSKTRILVFGEDNSPFHSLGLYCCYFSVPYDEADGPFSRCFSAPKGRVIWLRPDGRKATSRAFMIFVSDPTGIEKLDVTSQKVEIQKAFEDAGWETPRLLKAMHESEDFYLQEVGQVKTAPWHKDRFVLVGDAGYCPSPVGGGMGTSAAITGAYILAGELATKKTHQEAFESYEKIFRPYITQVQTLPPGVPKIACPQSSWGIWVLNTFLVTASFATRVGIIDWLFRLAPSSWTASEDITLPNYEAELKTPSRRV
jgi:2-polyprenyl-6-methoxyphenol hydroxylase-like FAD-dependent oxidoreductase